MARKPGTKTAAKELAQELLMHGIGNVLGYWSEDMSNEARVEALGLSAEEFHAILMAQADRAAKLLGYEQAWSN